MNVGNWMTNKLGKIGLHLGLWFLIWGLEIGNVALAGVTITSQHVINLWSNTLFAYLFIGFVFPSYLKEKSIRNMLIRGMMIFLLFLAWKYGVTTYFSNRMANVAVSTEISFNFVFIHLYRFIVYVLYAAGLWYFTTYRHNRYQRDLKKLELQQLRTVMLQAEINSLQAQINPHFLFNTLNFMFSRTIASDNPNISQTILSVSDSLRYMLKTRGTNQLVTLNEEIHQLEKVMAIYRLQTGNDLQLSIENNSKIKEEIIPSYLLISMLEEVLHPYHPSIPNFLFSFQINDLDQEHVEIVCQVSGEKELTLNYSNMIK